MQKEKKKKNKEEEVNESVSKIDLEEKSYVSIDKLQDHGVNVADINKLKGAGICTVKGLLMVTKKEVLNIKGISDQKLEKMLEKNGYDDLINHKKIHVKFVNKIKELKSDFESGEKELSKDVMAFLKAWLVEHIMGTDQKYSELMVKNKVN